MIVVWSKRKCSFHKTWLTFYERSDSSLKRDKIRGCTLIFCNCKDWLLCFCEHKTIFGWILKKKIKRKYLVRFWKCSKKYFYLFGWILKNVIENIFFYYFFALSHLPSKLVGDGDCVTNNDDWGWRISWEQWFKMHKPNSILFLIHTCNNGGSQNCLYYTISFSLCIYLSQ